MKKILLSLAAASLALSVSADKVVYIAADALSAWGEEMPAEIADADEIVTMPEGFFFIKPADRAPEILITKPLACKYLSMSATAPLRYDLEGNVVKDDKTDLPKDNNSYVTSGGFRWYDNCAYTFTPAKGVTVTKMLIRSQSKSYTKLMTLIKGDQKTPFTLNTEDTKNCFQTVDVNSSEAFNVHPSAQNRVFYIMFETTGTPANVAAPTAHYTSMFAAISNEEPIKLETETAGADIYYTLDGSAPTVESTKYSTPFSLSESTPLRAVAVKNGEVSFEYYEDFMVYGGKAEVEASFDFSNFTTLKQKSDGEFLKLEALPIATANKNLPITSENVCTDEGVDFSISGAKIYRSWTFGNVVELRPDNGAKFTVTAPDGQYISNIYIQGSKITKQSYTGEEGALVADKYNSSRALWSAGEGKTPKSIDIESTAAEEYIDQVVVFTKSINGGSGVAGIEAEENAPVEYYNLQGIRVANPENGLYIVKQGNKVTKRVIK